MRRLSSTLFRLALVAALPARADPPPGAAASEAPAPPLHPTAIMATVGKERLRVVAADGTFGVVQDQGKRTRLPASATFEPVRAAAFVSGSVEVSHLSCQGMFELRSVQADGSVVVGGLVSIAAHYRSRVRPSRDVPGCFVAILTFDPRFLEGKTDESGALLSFQGVGDLAAGVEREVDADFTFTAKRRPLIEEDDQASIQGLPLFFTQGWEIPSNYSSQIGALFHRVERLRHEKLLAAYLARAGTATAPAKAYLHFPPVFDPGMDRARLPPSCAVDYVVTERGTVEAISTSDPLPPDALGAITRALGGWLYLPRLENGRPARTRISTELDFGGPAPKA
jgi:hypothetical protein